MPKKLIPLTDNFLFKAIFSENPDLLLDLLNSFPEFQGEERIESLQVLNPELPKLTEMDKLSVLDIQAENTKGDKFLIEMQSKIEEEFPKRILLYWSKVYASTLKKGNRYKLLKKVYSINFTEFNFLLTKKYHSIFALRERTEPEILLTNDLEIHIIELPKFKEELNKLKTEFESWIYALKKGHKLGGKEMSTLTKKNPKLKKVFKEQQEFSLNPKSRYYKELREKSDMVMQSRLSFAIKEATLKATLEATLKGKLEGKLETADVLLSKGFPIDEICEITGLTKSQIIHYKKKSSTTKK